MVKIVLPWIDKRLNAHNKGHWRAKAEPTREARAKALSLATRLIIDGAEPIKSVASISYIFYVPNMVRRDSANMKQSCKPYVDGIVDSGLISGDHWQVLQDKGVAVIVDKLNPRVEITIERVDD